MKIVKTRGCNTIIQRWNRQNKRRPLPKFSQEPHWKGDLMKKIVSIALLLILVICSTFALAESNVEEYSKKLDAARSWTRVDYNIVYTNSAKNVLPSLLSYRGDTIVTSLCRVFGDETGEVWLITGAEVYRMWWSEEDYLVLTSTSDGLGYTGYGVFKPAK